MGYFKPNKYYKDIYSINYNKLKEEGIKCLVFDLDNTLGLITNLKCPDEITVKQNIGLDKLTGILYISENTMSDKFEISIDLPGYEKENLDMSIEDGYLTVHAKMSKENEDKEEGKYVRKERFFGECSRSFYVGEDVTEEDIKASFKNGTLMIDVPKKEEKKALPEKKYITIE